MSMSRLVLAGRMMAARRALHHQRHVHTRIELNEAKKASRSLLPEDLGARRQDLLSGVEMDKRDLRSPIEKYVLSFKLIELNNIAVFVASMSFGMYCYLRVDQRPRDSLRYKEHMP